MSKRILLLSLLVFYSLNLFSQRESSDEFTGKLPINSLLFNEDLCMDQTDLGLFRNWLSKFSIGSLPVNSSELSL